MSETPCEYSPSSCSYSETFRVSVSSNGAIEIYYKGTTIVATAKEWHEWAKVSEEIERAQKCSLDIEK